LLGFGNSVKGTGFYAIKKNEEANRSREGGAVILKGNDTIIG